MTRAKRGAKYSSLHPRLPSSRAHEDPSVSSSPDADALLVLYNHEPISWGLSLYALELDSFQPSDDDDDDAVKPPRRLPDPMLVFREDDNLPSEMGYFVSGSTLYMFGGVRGVSGVLVHSKATYYINLKDIPAALDADPMSVVRRGPDMKTERRFPLVIPVGGMFYVFSSVLSTSSRVERFDPGAVSWALLPADLGLPEGRGWKDMLAYAIVSYVVHAARIHLCTRAGVFVFDTGSGTWTPPEKAGGGLKYSFVSQCVESSQLYVAGSRTPGKLLLYPKHEACEFANPILGDFDLLDPYANYVRYERNKFLLQASRDRFCFVSDGCDLIPYGNRNTRHAKKHIVVHAFDLLQDAVPKAVDSLHSSPDYRHHCLSRVLYAMDDDIPWRYGRIANVFLINRKDLGHNAFKRPRLDCQK